MKRLFKLTGFLAGLGAAVWLMRDRLISLALPKEPEPPTFRVPPATEPEDLTVIKGIGTVFAGKLEEHGITTLRALANANPSIIASQLDTSEARVEPWIAEARRRTATP